MWLLRLLVNYVALLERVTVMVKEEFEKAGQTNEGMWAKDLQV